MRSIRRLVVPALFVTLAGAQSAPSGETTPPSPWSPRAAYTLAVLKDWAQQMESLRAAGRVLRRAPFSEGELWFAGYQVRFVQCIAEDAAPSAVIWPRAPSDPLWGCYVFPAGPAVSPECVFFLAPDTPLLWSENRATNYSGASRPAPAAALGRGVGGTWSARQRSAGKGEDGEVWQLAAALPTSTLAIALGDDTGVPLSGAQVRLVPARGLPVTDLLPPGVPLAGKAPAGNAIVGGDGRGTVRGAMVEGLVVRVSLGGSALIVAPELVVMRDGVLCITVAIAAQDEARRTGNEMSARRLLTTLASMQRQCRDSSVIDADSDGEGEFGFLGELAGVAPVRPDAHGGIGSTTIEPPMLAPEWGNLRNARMLQGGYWMQVFLHDKQGNWVAEHAAGDGAAGISIDPDRAEKFWCAVAWPMRADWTGRRVYFIDANGDLLEFANDDGAISGDTPPKLWNGTTPPAGWTVAIPRSVIDDR